MSSPTIWSYWSDGKELAVPLRARLRVSTIDAAIDAGLAGAGVARTMSYQVADYVRKDLLQLLLEAYEPRPVRCTWSTISKAACRSSCAHSSISSFPV